MMNRTFNALRPFIRQVTRRAGWVLALAFLLTAVSFFMARQLTIDTDFSNLVPDDHPSVQALEDLRATVGGESEVSVGIESPSFEANRAFADDLIPKALDLTGEGYDGPYLTRVDFRRDVDFLEQHALYLSSNEELSRVETFLDEKAEQARLEANPFYVEVDDDGDNEEDAEELQAMHDRLVGQEYPISDDSTTMAVHFFPSGAQTDIGFIDDVYTDLGDLVDEMDPTAYHPDMEVTLAGPMLRQQVELETITSDVMGSFGVGVAVVLFAVVLYFLYKSYRVRVECTVPQQALLTEVLRAPVLALVIAVPLLMSLVWTGAVAYLSFGVLTLMTSTLGLVLFGLGIDFGIHFYARYTEERAAGRSIADAAEKTFTSTGQAIATGAFTTAAALFVLTLADFRGFSEFGFIAGTGVLFALVAMTVVMPAMFAVFERTGLMDLTACNPMASIANRTNSTDERFRWARPIVVGSLAAVVVAILVLPQVEFEYDFGSLEPDFEEFEEKQDVIRATQSDRDQQRRNPAYIVLDDADEADQVVAALRQQQEAQGEESRIMAVESLQERFPLRPDRQAEKLQRIADIRETLADEHLQDEESEEFDRLRRAAQTREALDLDAVPPFLSEQFTTRDGEVGQFVIIYPEVGMADGRNSIAFAQEVGTVETDDGTTHHAGSTSIVAANMLMLLQDEAPWMIGGAFLMVALLMYLNFGAIRWAALALVPLVAGLLWMLLMMELFGLRLNFYNMVVLPAILGIGNDAGVHIVHRFREEGAGSIWKVLRSSGEHVTMGTLTTAIGFGGLLLSFHPGLQSMGLLAVIGLGTTLLAALTFLPALLQWGEDRTPRPDERDPVRGDGATETVEQEEPVLPSPRVGTYVVRWHQRNWRRITTARWSEGGLEPPPTTSASSRSTRSDG